MTGNSIQPLSDDMDGDEADEKPSSRYFVDLTTTEGHSRAISVVIAERRCYMDQQADDEGPSPYSDAQVYVDRIVDHCAQTPDYLLPDTPLKEAVFRVLLSRGNEPVTPEEISEILSEKWAMTAYPRDISPRVIEKLLENSETYRIVKLPEPEDELMLEAREEEPSGMAEAEDEDFPEEVEDDDLD